MGITVEFKDYEEMVAFARVLLNGCNNVPTEEKIKATAQKQGSPKAEVIITKEDTPTQEDEPTYTLEQVRARLTELTRAGKQKEVKELITSFGAKNVTSILPEHYQGLMKKAGEL